MISLSVLLRENNELDVGKDEVELQCIGGPLCYVIVYQTSPQMRGNKRQHSYVLRHHTHTHDFQ